MFVMVNQRTDNWQLRLNILIIPGYTIRVKILCKMCGVILNNVSKVGQMHSYHDMTPISLCRATIIGFPIKVKTK